MAAETFPFLFHGPSPDDWFDEPVHAWALRFVREPSAAERASLAAAWERSAKEHTRGLGADTRPPWLWSGDWALVQIKPGDRSKDTMRALHAALQTMLRAAHSAAPLAEVIYTQAADVSSSSEWEAWTVAQSPVASEAPPWPADVLTHVKKSRKRSKASADASFETAREQLRSDASAPRVASVTPADEPEEEEAPARTSAPGPKKKPAHAESDDEAEDDDSDDGDTDSETDDGDADGASDDSDGGEEEVKLPEPRGYPLRLVEVSYEEAEKARDAISDKQSKFERSELLSDGSIIAVPKASKRSRSATVTLVTLDESIETGLTVEQVYAVRAWSPSRRALLVMGDEFRALKSVPLDQSDGPVVWNDVAQDSANGAAWLADDTIVVMHAHGVSVYQPPSAGGSGGAHQEWSESYVSLSPDRRGLVAINDDAATVVKVVAPARGSLRIAGEVCVKTSGWCSLEALPDGLHLFSDDRAWRIEGTAEAIDALLASPDDTARFPELPHVASPEERIDPTRNTDVNDCVNRAATAWSEESNELAERWYRRAIELDPKNVEAWHGLGSVLQRLKREGEAKPCLERALAEYEARIASNNEDEYDLDETRFLRVAVLSRLRRRDDTIAALRALIPPTHAGNFLRRRVASEEEDFEWLRDDAEFKALTAKVAKPKRASKAAKKKAADADDESDDE